MAAVTKFLFDTAFDRPSAADDAACDPRDAERRRIEGELAAARAMAHADGLEEGRRAGRAEALAEIEAQAVRALEAAAQALTALGRSEAQRAEATIAAGLELAAAVMRKALPELARRHGLAEIEAVVADCLTQLTDEPRIVIRVRDSLLDALQQKAQALARSTGFAGRLVMVADPALGDSDCRVEWADGGVVRNLARLTAELDEALARALGKSEPEPPATSPPAPSGHP